MSLLRPLIVLGTRPEAIKLAPVVHACQRRANVEPIVGLTGQHRELVQPMIEYFRLPVDVNLELMAPGQSLTELTARCLQGLDAVLAETRPDCVIVQGDTTTAMAASLAAFYQRVPVVHVEAGLRTGDLSAPWPEEMNRRIISLAGSVHCAPTQRAAENLLAEGVPRENVHVTGNPVIDALHWTLERERDRDEWPRRHASLGDRTVVLVTAHRRESFDGGLQNIFRAIAELARRFPDVAFVFPVHANPRVQSLAHGMLGNRTNVCLVAPMPYPEFVWMMHRSRLILSDSGGVQEEAPSLGKPVVVLRDATERVEALQAGAVRLAGTCTERIVEMTAAMLTDEAFYRSHQVEQNPYGDGHSAERIADSIKGQGTRGKGQGISANYACPLPA